MQGDVLIPILGCTICTYVDKSPRSQLVPAKLTTGFAGFHLDKKNILKELKKLPMMHDVEYVDYIHSNVLDDIPEEGIESDTIVMP